MNKFVSLAAAVISSAYAASDPRYRYGSLCKERLAAMNAEWEGSCHNVNRNWDVCTTFQDQCDRTPKQCLGYGQCAPGASKQDMYRCCSGQTQSVEWPAANAVQQKPTPAPQPLPNAITETNRAGSSQRTCTGAWSMVRGNDDYWTLQHNGSTQQWCCTGCNCQDQSDAETCTGTSNSTASNTTQSFNSTASNTTQSFDSTASNTTASSNSTASISTRSAVWHTKWKGAKAYANSADVTDMDYYLKKSSNFTLDETPALYECLKKDGVYKKTLSCMNWNCKSHSRFYKQECKTFYQDKDTATYYQCKKDVITFEQACKQRSNELMISKFPNTTAMIESGASLSSNTTAANTTTPTSGATKLFAGASTILASAFVF